MEPCLKPISEYFIKPKYEVAQSKKSYHLAPLDLAMLSFHYIQNALLFPKPTLLNDQQFSINTFLGSLKQSLSQTLVHFYPLAGQLVIQTNQNLHESYMFVDCNKGPGARFRHASLDMNVEEILAPNNYVPLIVRSFFDYNGHKKPLLSVQVTELLDGIFIALSINHVLVNGTSYWQFWNLWSEIHRTNGNPIPESHLPIHNRWFPDGCELPIPLPFTNQDQFVKIFEIPSEIREKVFHFSSESIAKLKAKANIENNNTSDDNIISSFQALSALVWRSIVRANRLPNDQVLYNYMFANCRHRLTPPLPKNYFGTCIKGVTTSTTARELLENNMGWAANKLHESVENLTDNVLREFVGKWVKSPYTYHHIDLHDYNTVAMEHSPRFDMYGNDFGLGKPITVRSGTGNNALGVVVACPGYEGGGSVDLEICLPMDSMKALEIDQEFMSADDVAND